MAAESVTGVGPGIAYKMTLTDLTESVRILASLMANSGTTQSFRETVDLTNQIQTGVSSYTLPQIPSDIFLFKNGLLQTQGLDYMLNGSTITFLGSNLPQMGDIVTTRFSYTVNI